MTKVTKKSSRKVMMNFLERKGIKVCGTTEDFNGTQYPNAPIGIWCTAEDGAGLELFSFYSENPKYEFGVDKKLNEEVNKRGWYFSWNDPGTMMLYEI